MRRFFWEPNRMLKMIGKKIFTIVCLKFLFYLNLNANFKSSTNEPVHENKCIQSFFIYVQLSSWHRSLNFGPSVCLQSYFVYASNEFACNAVCLGRFIWACLACWSPDKSEYLKILLVCNRLKIIFSYFSTKTYAEGTWWDGSLEHPKHMFKLMDKKTFTIYAWKVHLIWSYDAYGRSRGGSLESPYPPPVVKYPMKMK